MTREEKARSLGQMYFPDDQNIWARPNYEAKFVSDACMQMAEWKHKRLVHNACEWLLNNAHLYVYATTKQTREILFDNFKKTMEE